MPNFIAAIVVAYRPDLSVLEKLLISVRPQVDILILVDNGGAIAFQREFGDGLLLDRYIGLESNLGLGYALNAGFEVALQSGVKYVATFDQDSAPHLTLIQELFEYQEKLEGSGVNCAAVSPVFFDRREESKTYFPFYFEKNGVIHSVTPNTCSDDVVEADLLITSGMLVRIAAWSSVVRYDASLFVDYTDTEWCFRARAAGYRLFGCLKVEMGHAPSDAPPARVFGLSFFRYSPLRRYYYFRNTVRFCLAQYVSWPWKRRLMMGLALRFFVNLLIDESRLKSCKMMLLGVFHGLRGKTGEFIS